MKRCVNVLRYLNLLLLVLYPIAWSAPLMRAGLLPLFGLEEISILSGIQQLWNTDLFLALIVALFAILAPIAKTAILAIIHFGPHWGVGHRVADMLGRLAMADIFLIALYVTVVKGVGIGRIEIAWGLYLFTFCVMASLLISWKTQPSENSA